MYTQDRMKNQKNKILLILPVLLILPLVIAFDSLYYLITRPSCLNCGNLLEFLKGASLTVFLLGNLGYKLKNKK